MKRNERVIADGDKYVNAHSFHPSAVQFLGNSADQYIRLAYRYWSPNLPMGTVLEGGEDDKYQTASYGGLFDLGCLPFTQKIRKFRLEFKWKG